MVRKLPNLDNQIAEISVHIALNTPHNWINIPRVYLPLTKSDGTKYKNQEARIYDIRVCELCYNGQKIISHYDKCWYPIGELESFSILQKYKAFLKKDTIL